MKYISSLRTEAKTEGISLLLIFAATFTSIYLFGCSSPQPQDSSSAPPLSSTESVMMSGSALSGVSQDEEGEVTQELRSLLKDLEKGD